MNIRKVIYLLSILRGASGAHGADLDRLYQEALDADPEVRKLKEYLDEHRFYRGIGASLRENASTVLDELYENPSAVLDTLRRVSQTNELIGSETAFCADLMRTPVPFSDSVTVLREREIPHYLEVLKQTASVCVYLMAVYEGVGNLKNLSWPDGAEIQEAIYTVGSKFLPALCQVQVPGYSWIISRKRRGGGTLFGGYGYSITYELTGYVNTLCKGLHTEAMGSHAFLNIRAFESGETDVPLCWGTGNLVSISPKDGLRLLQSRIVTYPRSPSEEELGRQLPAPMACLRKLTDGGVFCISPEDLVSVMNQWELGHEITKRRHSGACLFCGRQLFSRGLVCADHFTSELN